MNQQELLNKSKPILFNTEMVVAILDNKKTVTRRIVKFKGTKILIGQDMLKTD